MPRWLPRALVLAFALYGAFLLTNWAFHRLLGLLLNILVAFFLALAVEPAVDRMAARGMRRGAATGLVFLGVFVVVGGFLALLGSLLADQVRMMVENFPDYIDSAVIWINKTFDAQLNADELQDDFLNSKWVQNYLADTADNAWAISTTVLGGLFRFLTILLFSFYFAAQGPQLRRTICSLMPPARQAAVLRAWEIAVAKTGGYIYSRGLMALISGLAHYILFLILGLPYAPALAVWVGVISQFIPTVGTYLAGALPMLLAFTISPWTVVWVLAFVLIYQQFENYVLQPKITAKTVDIHPAVAFGSVIAGAALMGAVGALIAIPATATLQAFLGAYITRYEVSPEAHAPRRRMPGRSTARRMRNRWRHDRDGDDRG
ncbi:AI-2E family transporter [Streptomyces sp. A7024]|uniref:AI-2E family transporter n=2 Tax=Streptomyces coryli TaxID=1128680 RepID=A0A6G4U9V7_9ACTN|nr:AI-2E family transporter [Streptomyces coryli]NGN68913.1 AI-2E family transporter [Streptomyces coryli]